MKNKIRIFISIFIATILLVNTSPVFAFTTQNNSNYYSYSLEWSTINNLDIITSIRTDNSDIFYYYNEEGYRNLKIVNNISTYFEYENNLLINESTDNSSISYIYDDNVPIACIINDVEYTYSRDKKNRISGLMDSSNKLVAKYQYNEEGVCTATLGDIDGIWLEKSDDMNFIGNLNHLVAEGSYIDRETGWYYQYRRYYDPINDRFVNGYDIDSINMPFDVFSDLYDEAISMKNYLLSTNTYGKNISYSSTWYNSLSEVEIMARLIYGESNNNISQLRGVAWVLVNRKESSGFPDTFSGVCKASGQFAAITGGSEYSYNSRIPDTTSSRWKNATELACILSVCEDCYYFSGVVSRPDGYVDQCYFLSKAYFDANTRNVNYSTGTGEYKRGSTWYAIEYINQLGDPTGNVFFDYQ
jgi:hypothetical protein